MNKKKPVFLLAGGMPGNRRGTDPIMSAIFQESGKDTPLIAYTGTASGDDNNFFNRMAEYFRTAGVVKIVHAITVPENADIKQAQDILESADIIFISGGDVDTGMTILHEKNLVGFLEKLYRNGKVFFGSSAGAIMLAKEWVRWPDPDDGSSAELFPCLDFAPVICDCHDEAGGWEELRAALSLETTNTVGYGLTAGSAVKVSPEGNVEVLSGVIHPYIKHDKNIDRMADIPASYSKTDIKT